MFFIFKIYIFAIFNFLEKTSEIFWKFFQFYTRSFLHCKFFMNLMCSVMITVIRKFPINSNGRMERLMCNFHSPNLSIHQNSTQEPTWNFLVTLGAMGKRKRWIRLRKVKMRHSALLLLAATGQKVQWSVGCTDRCKQVVQDFLKFWYIIPKIPFI